MGTRTLLLVRHGHYAVEDGGALTELGREQARLTGRWIFDHLDGKRVDALWSSTLPRTRETAEIIGKQVTRSKPRHVAILREGMYTKVKGYDVPASERREDRARAALVWERFFRTSRTDRLEIIVCHGNLILSGREEVPQRSCRNLSVALPSNDAGLHRASNDAPMMRRTGA